MKKLALLGAVASVCLLAAGVTTVRASDHDDGESDLKGRALNLTDVYAFRENNQTGIAGDSGNLILIMNSNPRSLPGQQYYFSDKARYEMHVTRVADNDTTPTGADDVVIRLTFSAPAANGQQDVTVTTIKDGVETVSTTVSGGGAIKTTTLAGAASPVQNSITIGSDTVTLFAGLREDPFFFDVETFFKVRAGTAAGFKPASTAADFTAGYNVNAIVLRVPVSYLRSGANENAFDVWATVSHPNA